MFKKLNKKGFTLVELMVVIVIIGILAAVAIPKFSVASDKAKASEFPTVLTSIYSAEHTYQAENGNFFAAEQDSMEPFGVQIPASRFFSYAADTTTGADFVATCTVKKKFGAVDENTTATIDQAGVKSADTELGKLQPNWVQ
jgi:prepilin-type N-terminal cleavage/methylation domain-containing protein